MKSLPELLEKYSDKLAEEIVMEGLCISKDDVGEYATDVNLVKTGLSSYHAMLIEVVGHAQSLVAGTPTDINGNFCPINQPHAYATQIMLSKLESALKVGDEK